jgi:hypothetical protein
MQPPEAVAGPCIAWYFIRFLWVTLKSDDYHHQPAMRRLREKACDRFEQISSQGISPNEQSGSLWALDELVGSRTLSDASSPAAGGNGYSVVDQQVLTRCAVPGRSGEAPSIHGAQFSTSRAGSGHPRTASSSAYPGYLHRPSRGKATFSTHLRTTEHQTVDAIQLPKVPFVVKLFPGETNTAEWEHPGSSLMGQWYAHVRHMSDVE